MSKTAVLLSTDTEVVINPKLRSRTGAKINTTNSVARKEGQKTFSRQPVAKIVLRSFPLRFTNPPDPAINRVETAWVSPTAFATLLSIPVLDVVSQGLETKSLTVVVDHLRPAISIPPQGASSEPPVTTVSRPQDGTEAPSSRFQGASDAASTRTIYTAKCSPRIPDGHVCFETPLSALGDWDLVWLLKYLLLQCCDSWDYPATS